MSKIHNKRNRDDQDYVEETESNSSTPSPISKIEQSITSLKDSIKKATTTPPSVSPTLAPATGAHSNKRPRGPSVESPETALKRRENHRLIEKRRREIINNGIHELARVVPGHPKNRGTIILKAVEYISELEQIVKQAKEEVASIKLENSSLIDELAVKNKKINELLLSL